MRLSSRGDGLASRPVSSDRSGTLLLRGRPGRFSRQVRDLVVAMKPVAAPGNRFPELLTASLADKERIAIVPFAWDELGSSAYDAVVFHWPTEFFRPESRRKVLALLARALRDKMLHGTKFVWIVHNLQPHDGGNMQSSLTTGLFLRLLDGLIFLSETSRSQMHALYPLGRRIPSLVSAHGVYPNVNRPPSLRTAEDTKGRILFFGALRDYKNPVGLVKAARAVATEPFTLTVAGHLWPGTGLADEIRDAAGNDPRIRLVFRTEPIPEDELERMIDGHDAVVLPYTNVLNSGVAFHALSRNKPILAPAVGSLPELRDEVGADWVTLFEGQFGTEDLERFLTDIRATKAPAPDLSRFAWDKIGLEVADFLRSL